MFPSAIYDLVTSRVWFYHLASLTLQTAGRASGDTLLKTLSTMPSAIWALGAWMLLLRPGRKIRLRNSRRSHLEHLFQLGQMELNTSCCHGTQHTAKHQLGNRVLQGWGLGLLSI